MMELLATCGALAVPLPVMAAVVQVESGGNRYAIGVVGGELERQPNNLREAVATAGMLEKQGYNYSLGAAQINKKNFSAYGITSPEQAFDYCTSVRTGARILAECQQRAQGDWGKAFSCYYSGNFATGFKDGYVQKVAAAWQGIPLQQRTPGAEGGRQPAPLMLAQWNGARPAESPHGAPHAPTTSTTPTPMVSMTPVPPTPSGLPASASTASPRRAGLAEAGNASGTRANGAPQTWGQATGLGAGAGRVAPGHRVESPTAMGARQSVSPVTGFPSGSASPVAAGTESASSPNARAPQRDGAFVF